MVGEGTFRALVFEEADGKVKREIRELDESALPEGEVSVAISHSSLNYKDGMILCGLRRLVRQYPHVPGIDFAGIVERSDSPDYAPGDAVILTGWRVGEAHWGGYAERARVSPDWLVPLPDGLGPDEAMALGTAGFTAMLAVTALEEAGLAPDAGEVLVTGASGGLGGVVIALLAALGYRVTAATGRMAEKDYLEGLGAGTVIDRAELGLAPERSMRWAG